MDLKMNYNLISLFPTPILNIYDFISNEEREDILRKILNTEHQKQEIFSGDGCSTHKFKERNNFLSEKIIIRLENAINEYAKVRQTRPVKLDSYWSIIQNYGSIFKNHTHPYSVYSGSLYINVNNDSSKIWFDNPNPNIMNEHFLKENEFNRDLFSIQPKNGQLIVFPSWLKHGSDYDINKMKNRVSISFNTSYDL